ncbi:MAG: leucine--tRNA ligase [Candidatus Bathyarchaeota archaeon]|nr:leucine--tRNA ligase [Candidatus Bathyarchaeota archaeon]
MSLNWREIEDKWRSRWEESRIFEADPDPRREKCFVTFPYPYMNGPLHIGHAFTATRVDVFARFMRMRGFNTLWPWAWHWTGEPIVGAALRVKMGDKDLIRALKEIDGVKDDDLQRFVDPIYMAEYYTRESREAVKRIGFSIDWRREFHTTYLEPTYSRFIEWQYETLRKKGYVARGTHPVVWCPKCESPTGDHDRLEGEGVSPEEYTLLKFRFGDSYLPAATFRPETIYGVTNMFINPDAVYVEAKVDGENWIVSREAAFKLKEQLKNIEKIREFKGAELIGKYFIDPVSRRELPILPGWFVDPNSATGVVYSVPAHAPADWIAIKDLISKPEELKKFGIQPEVVKSIRPISLISIKDFGDYPAIEIVERMGIKDQFDSRVEEATSIIYREEFHTGILKSIVGKYAGRRVQDVKAELIEDFKKMGIADSMYDLPQKVICRCTTPCIVKVLSDQWFLRYSDNDWKKLAHEAVDQAKIYPEAARAYFHDKIDWLRDWACARRTGLGTPLPWSPDWIVETLSDSTIYMAFYTIAKPIRQHGVKAEQLMNEVFDYIFFGDGNAEEISNRTGISREILAEMKSEFEYWYPVDLRVSAKELVPNHLSFFIFQHVALFPRKYWPKGIGVNGVLTIEGDKMSKSKGNFVTLKSALDRLGADVTRLTLLLAAEDMDDPDWREENARSIDGKLRALYRFINEMINLEGASEMRSIDRWLLSVLHRRIRAVTEAIQVMKTRTAAEIAFFEVWNDIRWYMRRTEKPNPKVLREVANIWLRLLSPFIPYLSEELWQLLGNKGFISVAEWPRYDESLIDAAAEEIEDYVRALLEDTNNILKATKVSPRRICYYVCSEWKWDIYLNILRKSLERKVEIRDVMKEFAGEKEKARKTAEYISKIVGEINSLPQAIRERRIRAGKIDEKEIIMDAASLLRRELNTEIYVYSEDDSEKYDPKGKAGVAKPLRPAIYVEGA